MTCPIQAAGGSPARWIRSQRRFIATPRSNPSSPLGRAGRRRRHHVGWWFLFVHRAAIISLAARNKVPAVYPNNAFARSGGLLAYGPDRVDIFRRSSSYVDRILRGAKPADLPVQVPTKFEMAVNAKTARALGLTVPESILLAADEVIE